MGAWIDRYVYIHKYRLIDTHVHIDNIDGQMYKYTGLMLMDRQLDKQINTMTKKVDTNRQIEKQHQIDKETSRQVAD